MDVFQAPSERLAAGAATPAEIARFVVGAAVNAPSVHNTQPWWFGHDEHEISVRRAGEEVAAAPAAVRSCR
jgi:nitroreductase